MYIDLMSGARPTQILGERLERLTGDEASCCVPEYRSMGRAVRRSPAFARSLERMKALADTNRLLAVTLLQRRDELCACEIQAATGLSHATVSHHMAVLADAGLVTERREGKWMFYRLAPGASVVSP